MRCYRFTFLGHPSITATHQTTLEITKDGMVTRRGNCVIGVMADFEGRELMSLSGRYLLEIDGTVRVGFIANPDFSDEREIVIRRSGFISRRTLGTGSDKAACDLALPFNNPNKRFTAEIKLDEKAT